MSDAASSPSPTDWHRRPVGHEVGPCPICGAPTRTVDTRRIGEHRAVKDPASAPTRDDVGGAKPTHSRPIGEHVDDFRRHLTSKKNTSNHVEQTCGRVRKIIEGCKFATWSDVEASAVQCWLADQRKAEAFGIQTSNYYLRDFKSFASWMVDDRRTDHNPCDDLKSLDADVDEGLAAGWISRRKSPAGWVYVEIPYRKDSPKQARKIKDVGRSDAGVAIKKVSNARRNSLVKYYFHHFVPANLADRSPHTSQQYERALYKLCEFLGRDVTTGEVNDRVIDRFVEWAIKEGLKYETVRKYRAYLRRIVRAARPGLCEKESGKRPHEVEAVGCNDTELDIEGSLWRFFRDVYKPTKLMGRTEGSANGYLYVLRRMFRHFGRSVLVQELSDELLREHLEWMLAQDFSPQTANSVRAHILALWRLAAKKQLIDKLPDVDKLPEPKKQPRAWSLEELGRILDSCGKQKGSVGPVLAAKWWRALVLTIYDTGLRRRASLLIERAHLDLNEGWLFVPAANQKQNADQQFRLSTETLAAIREIWLPERHYLFPWKAKDIRGIWHDYGDILERAGLESGPRDKFHKLRRTTATHIAAAAGFAAACHQLGHSSETITRGYVDPRFTSKHDVANILPRPRHAG